MDSIWPQQDLDGNSCMFHRYLSEDNISDNSKIQMRVQISTIKLTIYQKNLSIFAFDSEYFSYSQRVFYFSFYVITSYRPIWCAICFIWGFHPCNLALEWIYFSKNPIFKWYIFLCLKCFSISAHSCLNIIWWEKVLPAVLPLN